MKILIYILMILGLGLVVFNASKLDLENPFLGDSGVAAVGILAAACAVLLMVILQISLKVKRKKKQHRN
jgi:UDP-N-acetylmuramyl pentapeptide phosphotransferase/UDP-N-acetylglucosamine-1-phosphate transferase